MRVTVRATIPEKLRDPSLSRLKVVVSTLEAVSMRWRILPGMAGIPAGHCSFWLTSQG